MAQNYRQYFRFIVTGSFATATYYMIALGLDYLSEIPVMLINTIAYFAGFVVSYAGQKHWTFKNSSSHKKTLPRFAFATCLGFILNSTIVFIGLKLNFSYAFSALCAIALVTIISFLIQRHLVFN